MQAIPSTEEEDRHVCLNRDGGQLSRKKMELEEEEEEERSWRWREGGGEVERRRARRRGGGGEEEVEELERMARRGEECRTSRHRRRNACPSETSREALFPRIVIVINIMVMTLVAGSERR